MKKKRVILKRGNIYKIPMEDGEHCYSIFLGPKYGGMVFFDYKGIDDLDVEEILKKNILFNIWVDRDVGTKGEFKKIGIDMEYVENFLTSNFFIYDTIGKKFELYITQTGEIVPSTFEEVKDLEQAASWADHHIKDRLRDHYLGIKCKWVDKAEDYKGGKIKSMK